MSERALSPGIPDFEHLSVPLRDPEGVNLGIMGLNEVVPPGKSSGILATTGALTDLASRGYVHITEENPDSQTDLHFFLTRTESGHAKDTLLPDEERLLTLLFKDRANKDVVHLNELARDPQFVPNIQDLRKHIRKQLTRGKQYFRMSPLVAQRLHGPILVGSLALVGVGFWKSLPAVGIGGALAAASETFGFTTEILETTNRQMLGDMAVGSYQGFLQVTRKHIENHSEIIEYLSEEANQEALASVRANQDLIHTYERSLGYLKIMKLPGIALFWASELAFLRDKTPPWFTPADIQPHEPYQPGEMAVSLASFLEEMDSVLLRKAR